jgi:hypothetical protein
MINDFQKTIYNCYLKNLRRGQPYKLRKDFSDIDHNTIATLSKISKFLTNYPHINCEEYFASYNELHPDDKFPPLNFFYSRGAIRNFSLYQKQKQERDPERQLDEMKESMKFIGLFCIKQNIPLNQYLYHRNGCSYSWLNHYREHKINPYCLFVLGDAFSVLDSIPKDELYLFSSTLNENLLSFYRKYQNSFKTKTFLDQLHEKVKFFVEKELTKKI